MTITQATQYFYDLTPDRIYDAFESAGLDLVPSLRWMNSLENRVIGVEDEEGERWVGKFYRPGRWSREALEEEHAFMLELFEADVPVRPPLQLEDGGTVGEIEGILFTIFPHQLGRMPDEIALEHAAVLGTLVAQIHNVGEKATLHHRPQIGPASWGLECLEQLEEEDVVPAEQPPGLAARRPDDTRVLHAVLQPARAVHEGLRLRWRRRPHVATRLRRRRRKACPAESSSPNSLSCAGTAAREHTRMDIQTSSGKCANQAGSASKCEAPLRPCPILETCKR